MSVLVDGYDSLNIDIKDMSKVGENVTAWKYTATRIEDIRPELIDQNPGWIVIRYAYVHTYEYKGEDTEKKHLKVTRVSWQSSNVEMTQHRTITVHLCKDVSYNSMCVFDRLPTSHMLPVYRPYSGCLKNVVNMWGHKLPMGNALDYIPTCSGDFAIASIGRDFIVYIDMDFEEELHVEYISNHVGTLLGENTTMPALVEIVEHDDVRVIGLLNLKQPIYYLCDVFNNVFSAFMHSSDAGVATIFTEGDSIIVASWTNYMAYTFYADANCNLKFFDHRAVPWRACPDQDHLELPGGRSLTKVHVNFEGNVDHYEGNMKAVTQQQWCRYYKWLPLINAESRIGAFPKIANNLLTDRMNSVASLYGGLLDNVSTINVYGLASIRSETVNFMHDLASSRSDDIRILMEEVDETITANSILPIAMSTLDNVYVDGLYRDPRFSHMPPDENFEGATLHLIVHTDQKHNDIIGNLLAKDQFVILATIDWQRVDVQCPSGWVYDKVVGHCELSGKHHVARELTRNSQSQLERPRVKLYANCRYSWIDGFSSTSGSTVKVQVHVPGDTMAD